MSERTSAILAGDIGGTKAVLGLCEVEPGGSALRVVREARFPCASYPSLEAILDEFLGGPAGARPALAGAAFGMAGPVRSEEHTSELQSLTNLVCRLLLEKKKTDSSSTP